MKTIKKLIVIAFTTISLYGCVAGQSVAIDYNPEAEAVAPADSAPINVLVSDKREFVVSGSKPPYYVGKYRAGFGNPWDVTTDDRIPLADVMAADVAEELEALGYNVADSGRTLSITIKDWNFDGWQNGHLWYDLAVNLYDADGSEVYSGSFQDDIGITGTLSGIKGGVERDIPVIYRNVIQKIIRDNEELIAALSR